MDFVRPRAIPALIAAFAALSAVADCASLEGTYAFTATKPEAPGEPPGTLSAFAGGKDAAKLYRKDTGGSQPSSWTSTETIQRGKFTALATKATLKHVSSKPVLEFVDASGKVLADLPIDAAGRWSCKDGRLERSAERMAGLGDSIRTERADEVLERSARGELVHRTTITVLEPKGVKPSIRESVFPAAR